MNDLKIFSNPKFGVIRTVEKKGKVLFCGSDVAKSLGYSNTAKAVSMHCKNIEKVVFDVTSQNGTSSKSRNTQEMSFIPEGDVYRLIIRSKLPRAEEFESWVFDDVLPSIRKTGMYATDELLDNPDLLISVATALKEEREQKKALETQNLVLEQKIAEYEPIVQYVDMILQCKDAVATSQIAADYGLSARRLNQILHEERIQHNIGGQWILYSKHMNKGYTKSETFSFNHSDGRSDVKIQTKWTQKGRLMIHNLLESRGIKANIDRENAS